MRAKSILLRLFVVVFACSSLGLFLACSGDGGGGAAGGEIGRGAKVYNANCALCHGQGGVGKPALGKGLQNNEFVAALSDDEVVEFLKVGRRADDPMNTKGVDMPPRGGNPGLADDDLRSVVAYLRSLR